MTHAEDVAPYLLMDGRPMLDSPGVPYVDAIVDRWGKTPKCAICIDGFLPTPYELCHNGPPIPQEWAKGEAREPNVWFFTEPLTPETVAAFESYLESPGCTAERHAWWERARLAEDLAAFEAAASALREANKRQPGWSVKK